MATHLGGGRPSFEPTTRHCPGCGSVSRAHFDIRVGTTLPARLIPCPLDPSRKDHAMNLQNIARLIANTRTPLDSDARDYFRDARDYFRNVAAGLETSVDDAFFLAAMITAATSHGQSASRRAYVDQILTLRTAMLDGTPVARPLPSYITGAPVGVTLNADGSLIVTVYLGEISQDDDADLTDDERAAIEAAVTAGEIHTTYSARA